VLFWHEICSRSHTCSEWSFEKDASGVILARPEWFQKLFVELRDARGPLLAGHVTVGQFRQCHAKRAIASKLSMARRV
jgi:hypothetical protein